MIRSFSTWRMRSIGEPSLKNGDVKVGHLYKDNFEKSDYVTLRELEIIAFISRKIKMFFLDK